MKSKRKLVYITNIPAPYQVKFCDELNKFFDCEFWFYENIPERRPKFWRIPLNEKCKIIPNVFFKNKGRHFTFSHISMLNKFKPDYVILGGFSKPANIVAYWWCRIHSVKCIVFTEKSRTKTGELRKKDFVWSLFSWLYRNVDMVMVATEDAVDQYKTQFGFGDKVVHSQYPADIDIYFDHSLRKPKDQYNLIFANRLIPIYNPLGAIRIFSKLLKTYPNTHLFMNAKGELKNETVTLVKELNLNKNITFLEDIKNWNELSDIYKRSDIYFFPAKYSNGNMSLVESMASGMGVVISDRVTGSGDYIKNGVNGLKVDLNDENFIKAVGQYIQKPELLEKHGKMNRKIVNHRKMNETAKLYYRYISSL